MVSSVILFFAFAICIHGVVSQNTSVIEDAAEKYNLMDPKYDPANNGPIDFKSAVELEAPTATVREDNMESKGQEDGQKYGENILSAVKKGISEGQLVVDQIEQEAIRTLEAQESATSVLLKQAKKFKKEQHDEEIMKLKKKADEVLEEAKNATTLKNQATKLLETTEANILEKHKAAIPQKEQAYQEGMAAAIQAGEGKMLELKKKVLGIKNQLKKKTEDVKEDLEKVDLDSKELDKQLEAAKEEFAKKKEAVLTDENEGLDKTSERISEVKKDILEKKGEIAEYKKYTALFTSKASELTEKKQREEQSRLDLESKRDKAIEDKDKAEALLNDVKKVDGSSYDAENQQKLIDQEAAKVKNQEKAYSQAQDDLQVASKTLADENEKECTQDDPYCQSSGGLKEKKLAMKAAEAKLTQLESEVAAIKAAQEDAQKKFTESLTTENQAKEKLETQVKNEQKRVEDKATEFKQETDQVASLDSEFTKADTEVKTKQEATKKDSASFKAFDQKTKEVDNKLKDTQSELKEEKAKLDKDQSRSNEATKVMLQAKTKFACAQAKLKKAEFWKGYSCKKDEAGVMRMPEQNNALCPISCCVPKEFYKYGKTCPNIQCAVPEDTAGLKELLDLKVITGQETVYFKRASDLDLKINQLTCASKKFTCEDKKRPGELGEPLQMTPLYDPRECAKYEQSVNNAATLPAVCESVTDSDIPMPNPSNAQFKAWEEACSSCQASESPDACVLPPEDPKASPKNGEAKDNAGQQG